MIKQFLDKQISDKRDSTKFIAQTNVNSKIFQYSQMKD